MTANENLVRRLFEAWKNRDYNAIAASVAADCTIMEMGSGRALQGIDGFIQFTRALFDAMPDAQFTLDHLTARDDTVVVEYTGRGTHTGDLVLAAGTVPATGRSLTVHACDVYEVENGKVQSARAYIDSGAIMAQLGLTERLGMRL